MFKKFEMLTSMCSREDLGLELSDILFADSPTILDELILKDIKTYLPKMQDRKFYLDPIFLNHKMSTFLTYLTHIKEVEEMIFIDFDQGDVINNNKVALITDILGYSNKIQFKWVKDDESLLSAMTDNISSDDIIVSNHSKTIEKVIDDSRDMILYVPEWGWTIGYEERINIRKNKNIKYISGYEEILDNIKNYDNVVGNETEEESIVNNLFNSYNK